MERKLVRLGQSSLVVSLPHKWVQRHGLTDEDRLQVRILPSQEVLISKGLPKPIPRKTSIPVQPDVAPYTLRRKLEAAYVQGLHEIVITGALTSQQESALHRELQSLMGLEIVDQLKGSIILRHVGGEGEEKVEDLLARSFHVVRDISTDLFAAFQCGESASEHFVRRDTLLNALTLLCMRKLTIGARDPEGNAIGAENYVSLFVIAQLVERIGDKFLAISQHIKGGKLHPMVMKTWKKTDTVLASLQKSYQFRNKPSKAGVPEDLLECKYWLREEIVKATGKVKSLREQTILLELRQIVEYASDLAQTMLLLKSP